MMYYGFNGTNWFKQSTIDDYELIAEAAPSDRFVLRYRGDKPSLMITHEIEELLAIKQIFGFKNKKFSIIYTASIDADPDITFANIKAVIDEGINVIAVEADNEYYSQNQANFDFDFYRQNFEPLKWKIEDHYPDMPFLLCVAPRPSDSGVLGGRQDHKLFNDAVAEYMENAPAKDGIAAHIYWGARECEVLSTGFPDDNKRIITPQVEDTEMSAYYRDLYSQSVLSTHWEETLSYLFNKFGRSVYITEFGFNGAGKLKNTLGYAAAMFNIWTNSGIEYRYNVVALCEHNGISPTNTGCITPFDGRFDDYISANVPRTSYWAFRAAMGARQFNLPEEGDPWSYHKGNAFYHNWVDGNGNTGVSIKDGDVIQAVDLYYMTGQFWHSSSGKAPFMAKGSQSSYEIDQVYEIKSVDFTLNENQSILIDNPPGLAFGFVVVHIKPKCNNKLPWWCSMVPRKWFRICSRCD